MKKTILPNWLFAIGILFFIGCAVPNEENHPTLGYLGGGGQEEDNGNRDEPAENNHMAIVEYFNPDFDEPGAFEKYSRAKVLILQPFFLWNRDYDPTVISSIKAFNPDIKILAYISAHATWEHWIDIDEDKYPYQAAWDKATRPYWSYTTTGDTMNSWPGKILINTLEEDARNAMVDVIAEMWTAHGNVFDGVFWDHFNMYLWVPDEVEGCEGEMDLDGDGIPHREDTDELQAYRDASLAMVQRFSAVMGTDVIQITNGNRAAKDSLFASQIDGMMYEVFPTVHFGGNEMRNALDPSVANNLFTTHQWPRTTNGGPYIYLTNKRRMTLINQDGEYEVWRRSEFNRVAALLTDNQVTYHPATEQHSFGWPEIELNLGAPLGGVTFSGDTIIRDFENGSVWLDFNVGNSHAPFQFKIVENGAVVQQFVLE